MFIKHKKRLEEAENPGANALCMMYYY